MVWVRVLAVLGALAVWPLAVPAAPIPPAEARVIDGDTLALGGLRVRLFGIDAPENDQACIDPTGAGWGCGTWARAHLAAMLRGQAVTCTALDIDRYGRTVARCHLGAIDVAEAMVLAGAAIAYRRYTTDYVAAETRARAAGRGMWAAGRQTTPEAHRSAAAPAPQSAPDPDCRIKGNIGISGKIYHRPGQRDYDATRINPAKGERWFCTPAEARDAGFRPARN